MQDRGVASGCCCGLRRGCDASIVVLCSGSGAGLFFRIACGLQALNNVTLKQRIHESINATHLHASQRSLAQRVLRHTPLNLNLHSLQWSNQPSGCRKRCAPPNPARSQVRCLARLSRVDVSTRLSASSPSSRQLQEYVA